MTLVGITGQLMQRLQAVQNAAARLIVGARKFAPVSHILCDQHWLPVRQRFTFKLCVLPYKCLHGMAPPYLSEFNMLALVFDEFTPRATDRQER